MSRQHPDLPVHLDRVDSTPLTVQLVLALRDAMRDGTLKPGERLPSTRAFATQLEVSRTVVTEAYQQLYAEGWLDGRHGSGTFVADHASLPVEPAPVLEEQAIKELRLTRAQARRERLVDLRPGAPWVRDYDDAAWKRAWRRAAELPPDDDPDPRGLPWLRGLLAEHVRRTRAVRVGPENIMVTRGTANGLDLVAALLGTGKRVGIEEPGYRVARHVLLARGAELVPCPVDRDGILTEGLPDDLTLLYATPAHQYPLGGRLPIARRERLLAWARRTGAFVIEDDYDAEFRYDVGPLPALYGLDPGRVILLGTLSKTLTPDIGVGWLVAGTPLIERLAELRDDLGDRTSGPAQYATAVLMERGDLDKHLRRMRLEYARRRAVIVEILGSHIAGDTAGLHVMLPLPEEAVLRVVAEAKKRGILLDDTSRQTLGELAFHGLILGYGSASLPDLRRACETLAELLRGP